MPITGQDWELHLVRAKEQRNPNNLVRVRTVGQYQVYHNGVAQTGQFMSGMFAESRGPGDNSTPGNARRVEAGRYSLRTQGGSKYATYGYSPSASTNATPKPGIELRGCAPRSEILIHPGQGFLASVGCINLCTSLPNGAEFITFTTSRKRVLAVIENLRAFLGAAFPSVNEKPVPRAFVVIDGEPTL